MLGGETMLCGRVPLAPIKPKTAINAIRRMPVSTAFSVTSLSLRQVPPLPVARLDQKNSWRPVTAPWWFLQRWAERRAQRHALLELADQKHLLDDIGLTRAEAVREAARPFWR